MCHVSSFFVAYTSFNGIFFLSSASSAPLISHIAICWKFDFVFGGDICVHIEHDFHLDGLEYNKSELHRSNLFAQKGLL